MMRYSTLGFIIYHIIVLSQAEKFQTNSSKITNKWYDKDLDVSETRYRPNEDYSKGDFPDYSRVTREEFHIPNTFKAPHYEAHDYWQNKHDYHNRRTFFENFSYDPRDKTTAFPGFFQFMTSVFGGRDENSPETFLYNRHRVTPPYTFDTPYNFRPTEPNYIPPPKPIRASVVKLETITRSPFYSSFDQETTTKYFPHFGTILNHVLIENSRAQKTIIPHPQETHSEIQIPPFRPLPVLPDPRYVPPTTLKPSYPDLFNNQTLHKFYNKTDYKYPESVQDQLPHLHSDEVKIPYVSEKSIPQIFDKYSLESQVDGKPTYPKNFLPPSHPRTTTSVLGLIDLRSLNPSGTSTEKKDRLIGNLHGTKLEFDTTTIKRFPGAIEKVKRPTFKYSKKLTAQLDKSSVERVANLTVQGFSKIEPETNSHKYYNHLNVKDLIDYEMRKLKNISQIDSGTKQLNINDSSNRAVNLNDELSLDAKILKDTNWDGLTVVPPLGTTKTPKEATTTITPTTNQAKRNNTAFWEIVQEQSTVSPPFSEDTTEAATTTEQISTLRTTPEFILWPSTLEITETSEFVTTEDPTTRKEAQRRSERYFSQDSLKPTTEDLETSVTTEEREKMAFKKTYSRRPKIVNFTPYPTVEELQKKLINRNNFPKRQKPNITLTFGNKNILKNRQSLGKVEVMKFSGEDLRRRKIGKRRQIFKRIKTSTSESPV